MIKQVFVRLEDICVDPHLARTHSAKVFEDHLLQSIREVGLAEPLKVARDPDGQLVIVDGVLRYRALVSLSALDPIRFQSVPVYVVPYAKRFEIRFQTDIYQDLLPSQLARLVEHLHATERIQKKEIAKYIGISAATLRNYTGLWRLVQRSGLFATIVDLMDRGIVPASNPYAWLRLTDAGMRMVMESLSEGKQAEAWAAGLLERHKQGTAFRMSIKEVEIATGSLAPKYYREEQGLREVKKDLGLRRANSRVGLSPQLKLNAKRHLGRVGAARRDKVLSAAAKALALSLD